MEGERESERQKGIINKRLLIKQAIALACPPMITGLKPNQINILFLIFRFIVADDDPQRS